jgi:hypothetical protein
MNIFLAIIFFLASIVIFYEIFHKIVLYNLYDIVIINSLKGSIMKNILLCSHCIFPTHDIENTAKYYKNILGFTPVSYLESIEPHICLYRDNTEIILTLSRKQKVIPNRELYGYGEDAYFITDKQEELQKEFMLKGAKFIKTLYITDYNNYEFLIEDIDKRWIAFGKKTYDARPNI